MKKLMIAAAAAAMVSGAFAVTQVADYQANVKYVALERVQGSHAVSGNITAFLKYVRTAQVRGYLVYSYCNCDDSGAQGNIPATAPAYLVVRSNVQTIAAPRIFPAELLVKMWDRSVGGGAETVEAEGYLFAGSGKGAQQAVKPWMADQAYQFGEPTSIATRQLFGKYNDPDGATFFESWMDHAGFGKATYSVEDGGCAADTQSYCLQTLEGSLIGGLYICHPNMISAPARTFEWFPCHEWLGTSDVICGDWAMRKFTNTPAETTLVAADGTFFTDANGGVAEAKVLWPMLKSAAIALGAANLGFVDADDTLKATGGASAVYLQCGSQL